MEVLSYFIDLFLHLDKHLNEIIRDYGLWTYLILFLIIFCETGLVVTPILPPGPLRRGAPWIPDSFSWCCPSPPSWAIR
jgi:hypothetical protein